MRVVHEPASEDGTAPEAVLATTVEVADSLRSQVMGLRFRDNLAADHALLIEVPDSLLSFSSGPSAATVDMLGVGFPIDVCWLVDGEVTLVKTLRPWLGLGKAPADTVLELPAGATEAVSVGDRVRVEGRD
ncbi:DUF192 domain-containing protein [Halobacteriales archaeon Cl-PHB]